MTEHCTCEEPYMPPCEVCRNIIDKQSTDPVTRGASEAHVQPEGGRGVDYKQGYHDGAIDSMVEIKRLRGELADLKKYANAVHGERCELTKQLAAARSEVSDEQARAIAEWVLSNPDTAYQEWGVNIVADRIKQAAQQERSG